MSRSRVQSKYGNRRVHLDGHVFDSAAEAAHYENLKILDAVGEITDLKIHPRFQLQPPYTYRGKRIRAIVYIADFYYWDPRTSRWVVEDVKGVQTQVFKLKRKMFEYLIATGKFPDHIFVVVEV